MDDVLKPNEEMLLTLATELGLMSIVSTSPEAGKPKPDGGAPATLLQKGATLT